MSSNLPSSPPPRSRPSTRNNKASSPKAKAVDPNRIRNNQRRCRARKKAYVARLEEQIRQHEEMGMQHAANQKVELLAAENRSLKQLLYSLGLRDEFLKAYCSAGVAASSISSSLGVDGDNDDDVGNGGTKQPDEWSNEVLTILTTERQSPDTAACNDQVKNAVCSISSTSTPNQASSTLTAGDAILPWEHQDHYLTDRITASETIDEAIGIASFREPTTTVDSLMAQAFSNVIAEENVSSTTTLCSWAFSLLLKSNSKCYSAEDLESRLRVGYRYGATPTEGCRIDNKVLLNVLAEVM